MKQIDAAIGNTKIIEEKTITGPRGSKNWSFKKLEDGRIALYGPDSHGHIPDFVKNATGKKHFKRCGGTTYVWTAWISMTDPEIAEHERLFKKYGY